MGITETNNNRKNNKSPPIKNNMNIIMDNGMAMSVNTDQHIKEDTFSFLLSLFGS